jgi:hypothetical protein
MLPTVPKAVLDEAISRAQCTFGVPAPLRFRQSFSKALWFGCPADVLHDIENERKATKAMETGSLVDQIVTGERNYHTIRADSFRTKVAQQERDAARERGQVPVLVKDLEAAEETAGLVRSELLTWGIDLDAPGTHVQRELEWTGLDGVPSRGKPDVFLESGGRAITIDLKIGDRVSPEDLERQAWSLCWDVQGATYPEGVCQAMGWKPGEHWIVRGSTRGARCITVCPFDSEMLEMGERRLAWCRRLFARCVETNDWPEHKSRPLVPHGWMVAALERRLAEEGAER